MIQLIFDFANEKVIVIINGKEVKFGSTTYGARVASIDGLKLSYVGVIKEHPDLEGNDNWRSEAIKRFKDRINSYNNEDEIAKYIIEDLKKFGYVPKYKQRAGFRPEAIR